MKLNLPKLTFTDVVVMLAGAVFAVSILMLASSLFDDPSLAHSLMLLTMVIFGALGANAGQRLQRTFRTFGYSKMSVKLAGMGMYTIWVIVGFVAIRLGPIT